MATSIPFEDVNVAVLPIESVAVIPSIVIADPETVFPKQVVIEEIDDTLSLLVQRIITDANLKACGLECDDPTDCDILFELNKPSAGNRPGMSFASVPATGIIKRLRKLMKDPTNPVLYFVYYTGKAKEARRKDGLAKASYLVRGTTQQPKTQATARTTPPREGDQRERNQLTSPRTPTSQPSSSTASGSRRVLANSTATPSPRRVSPAPRDQHRAQAAQRSSVFLFTENDDDHEQDRINSQSNRSASQQQSRHGSSSPLLRAESLTRRTNSASDLHDDEGDDDDDDDPDDHLASTTANARSIAATTTSKQQSASRSQQSAGVASTTQKQTHTSQSSVTNDSRGQSPLSSQLSDQVRDKRRRSQSPSQDDLFHQYAKNTFPVVIAGDMRSCLCLLCRSDVALPGRVHNGTLKRHFQRDKLPNHRKWLDFNEWALAKGSHKPKGSDPQSSSETRDKVDAAETAADDGEDAEQRGDALTTATGPVASEGRS